MQEEETPFNYDSMMNSVKVDHISECFIKPQHFPEESDQPFHLTPWDLAMLSLHYIQKGLLFPKPTHDEDPSLSMEVLLDSLQSSLSLALRHFYPLAGRLKTVEGENPGSSLVYVDCRDGPGARFIHASLDMTVSDILSPPDVPAVVQSLFDHDRLVGHDGHTASLLSVQVTELVDGVFIGCSMNHSLADGTSFWNFFNSWSHIFRGNSLSRLPILERWIPAGYGPTFSLPFAKPEEFISGFEAPELRERVFHFSLESVAKLKAKANAECSGAAANKISSLQSVAALVWRCITRARNLAPDQKTVCKLSASNRSRLEPPVSENYFGNSLHALSASTSAGELLKHDLGWAASKLHHAVVSHNDKAVREFLDDWLRAPYAYQTGRFFDPCSVMMGSSPRFNKYGCEFGMGKALALRSGYANKFSGKVSSYPGREGGGSIDLEMCLPPEAMRALESDNEFTEAAF